MSLKVNTTERMTVAEFKALTENKQSKSKYHSKMTEVDGILFDSQAEAKRYCELKLLLRAGKIDNLRLQVPFTIVPKQADERAVKYLADFVYSEGDKNIVEDVKSSATKTKGYIIKRKLFKMTYPDYEFREVEN